MPTSALQWASHTTLILVVVYALWAGGRPERLAACAVTLAYAVSPYAQYVTTLIEPQYGVLAVDGALFLALLALALTTDRRWLLFATAAHGLGVMTHLAATADPALLPRAYLSANIATSYLVLGALAFGAWRHRRISADRNLYSP